jgi:sugar phosphate permease
MMAVGGVGWLSAATPLALLTNWLGWRMAFILIGIVTLMLAAVTWLFIRNRPEDLGFSDIAEGLSVEGQTRVPTFEGIRRVLTEKYFWPLAIRSFFNYGTVIGFGGLWGGPYLIDVYGLSKAEAGSVLMMIALGMIVGSPLLGWLSDKVFEARKPLMIAGMGIYLLVWIPLAFWTGDLSLPLLYVISLLIGASGCSTVTINFPAVKELFPREMAGLSTGLVNIFPFAGAAIFPPFMGYIMDSLGQVNRVYTMTAYKGAFTLCLAASVAAFAAVFFMKETLE